MGNQSKNYLRAGFEVLGHSPDFLCRKKKEKNYVLVKENEEEFVIKCSYALKAQYRWSSQAWNWFLMVVQRNSKLNRESKGSFYRLSVFKVARVATSLSPISWWLRMPGISHSGLGIPPQGSLQQTAGISQWGSKGRTGWLPLPLGCAFCPPRMPLIRPGPCKAGVECFMMFMFIISICHPVPPTHPNFTQRQVKL